VIKFKFLIISFIYLFFTSSNLLALTLNKMQVNSKQDEPLNAFIDVTFSKGDKVSNLKPAIASTANYEAQGISRLPIHSDIQIRFEGNENGAKLFLTSNEIIKDPFLDLLIQIDSEKGRIYKEYTVLIDPPAVKKSIKEVIEVKSNDNEEIEKIKVQIGPVKNSKKDIESVEKVVAVKEVKKPIKEKEVKFKIVKSKNGKTLYQIARENKPSGVTTEQMVLAIYKNNPKAFSEKNVNTLIKNRKLKIPPVSYFKNNSHLEARKILRDHNVKWKDKLKKTNKLIKQKKIINKDAEKIDQLERELSEAKKKLEDISRLNIESENNSIKPLKDKSVIEKEDQTPEEEFGQAQEGDRNDEGVFVSSISDIDENKIDETEIDIPKSKGLETIHVLLLTFFAVLLFGLFVVISRRKVSERNQTLRSFVDENQPISNSESAINPQGKINIDDGINDKGFIDEQEKSQEQGGINDKKNYPPIADDD
jgi:FimV-like protein